MGVLKNWDDVQMFISKNKLTSWRIVDERDKALFATFSNYQQIANVGETRELLEKAAGVNLYIIGYREDCLSVFGTSIRYTKQNPT